MWNLRRHDTEYHSVPKNGGTTVRYWMNQHDGHVQHVEAAAYVQLDRPPVGWRGNDLSVGFEPSAGDAVRWCVVRDPVARFASAYDDKVLRERRQHVDVDAALDGVEAFLGGVPPARTGLSEFMLVHLVPQTFWLGEDLGYYDHVWTLDQMLGEVKRFCEEEVFRMPLAAVHLRDARRSRSPKVRLTADQERRVRRLARADVDAGFVPRAVAA